MNDVEFQDWVERANLGLLSPEQEAECERRLAADPERLHRWHLEKALNNALRSLPPVPVHSGFTEAVLRAVERDATEPRASHQPASGWLSSVFRFRVAWQFALGCAVIGISVAGVQLARQQQLAALANTVASVSDIATLPSVDALKDFEAVINLPEAPVKEPEKLLKELADQGR